LLTQQPIGGRHSRRHHEEETMRRPQYTTPHALCQLQRPADQSSATDSRVIIEHITTADDQLGSWPPTIDIHGAIWVLVRRGGGTSVWRRIMTT
jgi:hypothetical protein